MATRQNKQTRNGLRSVVIAWRDHHDVTAAWFDIDEVADTDGCLIITQGFIVDETPTAYTIARDVSFDANKRFGGGIVILKGTVAKVWELGVIDHE